MNASPSCTTITSTLACGQWSVAAPLPECGIFRNVKRNRFDFIIHMRKCARICHRSAPHINFGWNIISKTRRNVKIRSGFLLGAHWIDNEVYVTILFLFYFLRIYSKQLQWQKPHSETVEISPNLCDEASGSARHTAKRKRIWEKKKLSGSVARNSKTQKQSKKSPHLGMLLLVGTGHAYATHG